MKLRQDSSPNWTVGEKGPEPSEVLSRASQIPFLAQPWYIIESDSKAFETLKSHIYSSALCWSIVSQETAEMRSSRNVKSIKHHWCGNSGSSGDGGGRCSKGRLIMSKLDGLFANKGEGLGLLRSSSSKLQWIWLEALFCRGSASRQTSQNTVLYPPTLSLQHETSN